MGGNSFSPQKSGLGLIHDPAAAQAIGALNTVGIAAFLCDAQARVRAMTPCAQTLLGEDRALEVVGGRLRARSEGADLSQAIRQQAAEPGNGATVLIPMEAGPALVLDITPLIREVWAAPLAVRVLVTSRARTSNEARSGSVLQASFGLTLAETQIALSLARGRTPGEIAAERSVSIQTVRTQIRSLYSKVGVGHRAALASRLSSLL